MDLLDLLKALGTPAVIIGPVAAAALSGLLMWCAGRNFQRAQIIEVEARKLADDAQAFASEAKANLDTADLVKKLWDQVASLMNDNNDLHLEARLFREGATRREARLTALTAENVDIRTRLDQCEEYRRQAGAAKA